MSEFIDYLREAFSEFGPVTARKMFGGHGIFYNGLMIGWWQMACSTSKSTPKTLSRFEDRDLPPFEYSKDDKTVVMSYRLAPEDRSRIRWEMCEWAQCAYEAALRSRRQGPSPR